MKLYWDNRDLGDIELPHVTDEGVKLERLCCVARARAMTKTVLAFILCSAVVSSGLAQDSAPTVTKDVPDVTGNFERERETLRRMIAAGILAPPEP